MQKTRLIFFGNEQLAQGIKAKTPIFDALLNHGYQICALVLTNANTRSPFVVAQQATKHQIPIFYTKDSAEILKIVNDTKPDLGILASFGKIIPDSILRAIPHGIINIHPSLLPAYRGTTPIEAALLNGDTQTGVSIMRLVKEMDAGPILAQAAVDISPDDSKQSLYETLASRGAELLVDVIPKVITGTAHEHPQDSTKATFTAQLTKNLSALRPTDKSATQLSREIRAYAGFPKSKTSLLGVNCAITTAHPARQASTDIDLLCADGDYLVIDRLIPENSREMTAQAFLNGHQRANTNR